MKIIDADKLHYKQVYIATEKGTRPALVVFAKEIRKMPGLMIPTIPKHNGKFPNWVVFAKEIRKMPEIVRCRDCKWRNQESANCERFRKDWYVQADSFCSWGERKEDETD